MDKKKLFAAAAVGILMLAGAGFVISRNGPQKARGAAAGHENYPIPPDNAAIGTGPNREDETALAISPADPDTIVVGSNDENTPTGSVWCGLYVTHDRGKTWKQGLLPGYPGGPRCSLTGYRDSCDPSIAADSSGNFYYAGIAYDRVPNPQVPSKHRTAVGPQCVFVARSSTNGDSFDQVTKVWEAETTHLRDNDKEWIAVDPNDGAVCLAWVIYTPTSRLVFSKSTDGGKSWSLPMTISGIRNGPQGTAIAVDRSSTIHLSWIDYNLNSIRYAHSTDHGASFSTPVTVASLSSYPNSLPNANYRTPVMTELAVDKSDTNLSGSPYITWWDYSSGDADVLLSYSHDGGATWADPVRVNNDTKGNGKDQFFPTVAVSAEGWVHVGFYDRRSDPANTLVEYWWAISFDGGKTFPINIPMSNASFNGDYSNARDNDFIGDYTSIAANNETVAAVWCDCRNGSASTPSADVYGAIVPYKELLKTNKFQNVTIPWPDEKAG